jgi:tetratricopeptide (TPR) repeat protein
MKTVLVLCALAATAFADPTADRRRAEQLERDARASGAPEAFAAVAAAYMQLYNADPQAPGADELLFNAAVAFEQSRAIGAAIHAFTLLRREYPNGALAIRSLARLAWIYRSIAMYDKAAEALEEYGKKYAGEKDAADAMSDAIYFRKAIGDHEKAIANTNYFVKTFGGKRPRDAAEAMWGLSSIYEAAADPDRLLRHLREYLGRFGSRGAPERLVIANAKIGELLWKESCPHSTIDGLCIKTIEDAPRTCGSGLTRTTTPTTRGAAKTKEALAAFAAAVTELERRQLTDAPARYFYARAKLAAADAELEAYFAVTLPRDLDFDPANNAARTTSVKRFADWFEKKQVHGASLVRKYEAVLAIKDAASSITAAARLGLVAQSFASTLVTGVPPSKLPKGKLADEKRAAYCSALDDSVAPLEARAVNAFTVCLAKSTELSWFDESSRLCERELARLDPAEFPLATELRAQPSAAATVLATEPPL